MIIVLHKKNVHSVGRIIYKKWKPIDFLWQKYSILNPLRGIFIFIVTKQKQVGFFFCNTAITVIIGRHFGVSFNSTFTEICLPMIWFLWIKTWVGGRKRFLCYFTIEPMNSYGCVEINQQHVIIRKYLKDSNLWH